MSEKFNNKVIEVLDASHGQKVKAYLRKLGCDIGRYEFNMTLEKGSDYRYYGVVDGRFSNYSLEYVRRLGYVEIITLPEEHIYPKVMWVSADKSEWYQRVVFMKKNNKYIAWSNVETIEDAENMCRTTDWEYAKDIEPELNLPKYKVLVDLPLYNIPKGTELYLAGLRLSTMTQNSPFMWNNEIIRIPNELVKLVSDGCI